MHGITVRPETAEDVRAIDVVNLSAFEGEEEARLVSALRRSGGFIPQLSLVAEFHGRIVGHVMLSRVELRRIETSQEILALAPMSVVPSQSHRGIGSELVRAALQQAGALGYGAVVESGQPDYYERLGFRRAAVWKLTCNLPVPDAILTAMELQEGLLAGGGHVIYPSPFIEAFRYLERPVKSTEW